MPASPGSLQIKQKLKDDLKCVVCLRDFCSDGNGSAPVTLPCGHNFCAECVGGMRGVGDENHRRAFRCPLDRTMFSRHIELKVNSVMRDLIGFMHSRVHGLHGGSGNGGANRVMNDLETSVTRQSRLGDAEIAPGVCGDRSIPYLGKENDTHPENENPDTDRPVRGSPRTPGSGFRTLGGLESIRIPASPGWARNESSLPTNALR